MYTSVFLSVSVYHQNLYCIERIKMYAKFLWGNIKEVDHLEEQGV